MNILDGTQGSTTVILPMGIYTNLLASKRVLKTPEKLMVASGRASCSTAVFSEDFQASEVV
jgi:hypothetical protein